MEKDKLLPDAPEIDEESGNVTDPEEQKALDKFYREHPDAMRKWVDTDDSAFGAFPDVDEEDAAEGDETDAADAEDATEPEE